MWGPAGSMLEDPSPKGEQGLAPRIFQMLFSEIQREKIKSGGKEVNYQCRCSFLEIYNGQISDLIDQTQRNLKVNFTNQQFSSHMLIFVECKLI
jgi:kinesin family protein 15